ncbi:ABC transporter ATP-binding protein [Celeribacter sp.]|uniref:ABC transporter ATP-binding protein n=1 Tax=Celeribacter sp. TaxID=1890673 RepID=UPI003A936CF1
MSISNGTESPILRTADLSAGYGRSQVLFGIDFNVAVGQTVALIGRNGAGKTTFLQTLMGEVAPMSGGIAFRGASVDALAPSARAMRGLGYVPQDTPVFRNLSVRDNLLAGAVNHKTTGDLDQVISLFPKLADRMRQAAGTLSGGERKMLGICRALLGRPALLMLDEPTEGVWIGVIEEIADRLSQLQDRMAIVIVEQHLDLALRLADRVDVMDRGKIALSGAPDSVRENPEFLRLLAP